MTRILRMGRMDEGFEQEVTKDTEGGGKSADDNTEAIRAAVCIRSPLVRGDL